MSRGRTGARRLGSPRIETRSRSSDTQSFPTGVVRMSSRWTRGLKALDARCVGGWGAGAADQERREGHCAFLYSALLMGHKPS